MANLPKRVAANHPILRRFALSQFAVAGGVPVWTSTVRALLKS